MVRALEDAALAERFGEAVLDRYERAWDSVDGRELVELSPSAFAAYLAASMIPNPWKDTP